MEENIGDGIMNLRQQLKFYKMKAARWLIKLITKDTFVLITRETLEAKQQVEKRALEQVLRLHQDLSRLGAVHKNLNKFRSNSEFHIKELIQTISRENSKQETIAMSVNHILGQMQDIMSGKGYNPEQRWVVFNPAMSMQNERTLHDKQ